MKRTPIVTLATLAILLVSQTGMTYAAQTYPNRPINLVVPWGPGGGSDQMVRALAPILEKALGVEIAVSDVPGGTGSVGMEKVLSAKADGYTIGEMSADTLPFIAEGRTPFSLENMQGVCQLMDAPEVLFVNAKDKRFPNWNHFKKYAEKHRVTIDTAGSGGLASVPMAQFKEMGLHVVDVPENKPSKRYAALLGEHVDAMIDAAGNSLQYVEGGEFRPILVLDRKPYKAFPKVETASKLNISFFVHLSRGLYASSKLSPSKVAKLSTACKTAFYSKGFQKYLHNKHAVTTAFLDAHQFSMRLKDQVSHLKQILSK